MDFENHFGTIQRLLNGQIPHLDFNSFYLVGAPAINGIYNFFIHNNNFQISRIITLIMVFIYSNVLVTILIPKNHSLSNLQPIISVSSFVINLHFMFLFHFYTFDGIFYSIIGFYTIKYLNRPVLGSILLGLSILMKTVFVISTFSLVAYLLFYKDLKIKNSIFTIFPSITYIFIIFLNGGMSGLVFDLSSNETIPIKSAFHHLGFFDTELAIFIFLLVGLFAYRNNNVNFNKFKNTSLFLIFIIYLNITNFSYPNYKPWLNILNLIMLVYLILSYKNNKDIERYRDLFYLIYVIEASAIISIGHRWGQYLSGSLIVLILIFFYENITNDSSLEKRTSIYELINKKLQIRDFKFKYLGSFKKTILVIFIIIGLLKPVIQTIEFRTTEGWLGYFFNFEKEKAIYNLDEINGKFGNIYTTKNVFNYLMELDKCINEIPHNRISIVPESPQLAFIFDLEDPLPLDWIMKFGKEDNYLYNIVAGSTKSFENNVIFLQSYKLWNINDYSETDISIYNGPFFQDLDAENEQRKVGELLILNSVNLLETCGPFRILRY